METSKAIKRDGSAIELEDEVTTNFPGCNGYVFVVEKIIIHPSESGYMVVAALKDDRKRKILGLKKEGLTFVDGIDANWFTKNRSVEQR